MGNVIVCIVNEIKGHIETSCTQSREIKWCHQNSEFPATMWCLWWLPSRLELTPHTRLEKKKKKDFLPSNCELNVWGAAFQAPLNSPGPALWGAGMEKDRHWAWNPKVGLSSSISRVARREGIHHWYSLSSLNSPWAAHWLPAPLLRVAPATASLGDCSTQFNLSQCHREAGALVSPSEKWWPYRAISRAKSDVRMKVLPHYNCTVQL